MWGFDVAASAVTCMYMDTRYGMSHNLVPIATATDAVTEPGPVHFCHVKDDKIAQNLFYDSDLNCSASCVYQPGTLLDSSQTSQLMYMPWQHLVTCVTCCWHASKVTQTQQVSCPNSPTLCLLSCCSM